MGELVIDQFMTLDGVVQAPGAPDEDTEGGFRHGGWQAPFMDEEAGKLILEEIERSEALLLGRRTYDIFANYWPNAPTDEPIAKKLNAMPKYVASRTLRRAEWNRAEILGPDLPAEVRRIKARHGNVHVTGSAGLAQTLLRERLVDRLNLWIYPLALGSGKRLFAEGTVPTTFRLARSKAFASGALLATYETAGVPRYGTIGEEA